MKFASTKDRLLCEWESDLVRQPYPALRIRRDVRRDFLPEAGTGSHHSNSPAGATANSGAGPSLEVKR